MKYWLAPICNIAYTAICNFDYRQNAIRPWRIKVDGKVSRVRDTLIKVNTFKKILVKNNNDRKNLILTFYKY